MAEHISAARAQREQTIESIKEKIQKSKSLVIVNYKALTVAEDTALRSDLRSRGIEYRVLKNTLVRRAFNDLGNTDFDAELNGTNSFAFSYDDVIAAPKAVFDNAKKYNGKFIAKCAYCDGKFADAKQVEAYAKLPSREVLLAKMLGSMNAPVTGFVGVLAATLRSFVFAVKAIQEKKAENA